MAENIPPEILLYIFEYLSVESIAKCMQVCKYWNVCALDPSLWRSAYAQLKTVIDPCLAYFAYETPSRNSSPVKFLHHVRMFGKEKLVCTKVYPQEISVESVKPARFAVISHDGTSAQYFYSPHSNGVINKYCTNSTDCVGRLFLAGNCISTWNCVDAIPCSSDSDIVVAGAGRGEVYVWKCHAGSVDDEQPHSTILHCGTQAVFDVQLIGKRSAGSDYLGYSGMDIQIAAINNDGSVRIKDIESQEDVFHYEMYRNSSYTLHYYDSLLICSGTTTGQLAAYDIRTPTAACVCELKKSDGSTTLILSVHHDGRRAVAGDMSATHIWDLRQMSQRSIKSQAVIDLGDASPVHSVHFDTRWIVTGGNDRKVRLWNWSDLSGEQFTTKPAWVLEGHTNWIRTVTLCADKIFSAGLDRMVRVWEFVKKV